MKIAILYICTGVYDVFWRDFYKSCEEYFLVNHRKEYYVFTDAATLDFEDNDNVHKVLQNDLGWPGNTLYRFMMFIKVEEYVRKCDYVYFFNANMLFKKYIGEEFLSDKLTVVKHPGYYDRKIEKLPYDRNEKSRAYIPFGEGKYYVMGGVNGGPVDIYYKMVHELSEAIKYDDANGIIAKWHDESHLNKYILSHEFTILEPSYGYPEGWRRFPFECKIMIRNKIKHGGKRFLENKKWPMWKIVCSYLGMIRNLWRKH